MRKFQFDVKEKFIDSDDLLLRKLASCVVPVGRKYGFSDVTYLQTGRPNSREAGRAFIARKSFKYGFAGERNRQL